MTRPFINRKIELKLGANYFKPRGTPMRDLEEVIVGVDEIESIRLADFEGLYQAEAAEKMGISRQTFGNILKTAHAKIADALINGKAIKIEGGPITEINCQKKKCHRNRGR